MTTKTIITLLGYASLLFASCDVKDPIYDTPHPELGRITFTTNWNHIGEGLTAPGSYTIKVGEYSVTASGTTYTLNNLFEPQNYRAYIYNTPDNITISGTTASVAAATPPTSQAGTFIQNSPQWFFTSAMDVTVEKDKCHEVTALMQQQVRQLTLVIEPAGDAAERIENITATLSGIAGVLDIDNGTHSKASNVALNFSKDTDGKWSVTVRLLGVTGMEQKLSATISFTDGNPQAIPLDSNLSAELSTFNNDKHIPLELSSKVVQTPTGTGFTATITSWKKVERAPVVAN